MHHSFEDVTLLVVCKIY